MEMGSNKANLYFKSKKISLIMLAATAMIFSRVLFFFFNDPDGPNLLIVTAFALVIFCLSSSAYIFSPLKIKGIKRLFAVIGIQILSVISLYWWMS